ncbi:MAG TPA: hypothetical protein VFE24_10015, partial [Pirellulales bacterium]|nr:hypothetical protein [Pirellulales bacterium]
MPRFSQVLFAATLVSLTVLTTRIQAAENTIYAELLRDGVRVGADEVLKLPAPVVPDGLNGAEQRQAIEKAMESKYRWEDFTRNAVVSPFFLKIADAEEGQAGRRLDVYFVAYGDLSKLDADQSFTGQLNTAAA